MELVNLKKSDGIKYSVVVHPDLASDDSIMALARDYKKHRNNEVINLGLFGRDVPFTENKQLEQSCIFKVHLIEEEQYNFKIDQFSNTSDLAHLVYCEHVEDPTNICVIDFLTPNAHQQAYRTQIINRMLARAEKFHSTQVKKAKIA
jgi:mRNA interferase YafO